MWKKCESFSAALAAPAKDGAFSAVRANAPWLEDEDASVLRRPRAALLEMLLLLALAAAAVAVAGAGAAYPIWSSPLSSPTHTALPSSENDASEGDVGLRIWLADLKLLPPAVPVL